MSFASDFYSALAGYAGLSALVGARVYPDVAPSNVVCPYVVWSEVSNSPMSNIGSGVPDSNNYRVQVMVIALTALNAREVAEQVRNAARAATTIKCVELDYASADFDVDSKRFGVRVDLSVWHRS
jgi:hypothetical protein